MSARVILGRWLALACLLVFFMLSAAPELRAAVGPLVRDKNVAAQLVLSPEPLTPGGKIWAGVRLVHNEHWHTYWVNPGTGYATKIAWTLPPGWKAGEIEWPTPKLVKDRSGAITGIGYEGDVVLPVALEVPADWKPGAPLKLAAEVEWLMCDKVCIPGSATVLLETGKDVPVTGGAGEVEQKLAQTLAQRAGRPDGWTAEVRKLPTTVQLRVTPPAGASGAQPGELQFFSRDGLIDYAVVQQTKTVAGGWQLDLTMDEAAAAGSLRLVGELVAEHGFGGGLGRRAWAIDLPLDGAAAVTAQPVQSGRTLAGTLGLAFLGGLILNLMPCVFPVLGVKILGFVRQAGADRRKVVMHGLLFSAGVLASLWTVAGALLVLRAGGQQLGWGFQLQEPAFVYGLAVLLLFVGLNLSGLFEVGLTATGVGADLASTEGLRGTFFSGVLATVVATPCSAPFLAPALGSALSLPPLTSMLVFTAIACGLAFPYLLLSLFPQAVRMLPRPGAWMETFKHVMAFPVYATVAALVWVLAGQVSEAGLLAALLSLVLCAFGGWAYGRGTAPGVTQRAGRILVFVASLAVAGGIYAGWPTGAKSAVEWQPWSSEAVEKARASGKIVYVDFTARWCATCQTNKKAVFSSEEVLGFIRDNGVVTLKADWTNKDPAITAELARFGRSAVPFNLVYLPKQDQPVLLPEILYPSLVLAALRGESLP